MIHLKNFTEYTPDTGERAELNAEFSALFLRSQGGVDWYDAQTRFKPDTLKIAYDQNCIIVGYSTDVSTLVPYHCSVVEMSLSEVPNTLTDDNTWQFIDGKIVPRMYSHDELVAQADAKKATLFSDAATQVAPLQDAADIDDATEDELAQLKAWKVYRVALNRINTSKAPDVEWPKKPEE